MLKSFVVGAATAAGAVAFASVERRIAGVADRAIQRVSGAAGHGAVVSHLTSVAAITAGLVGAVAWITHRVEAEISVPDGVLGEPPTSPFVSGCHGSAVSWAPLTRDARRHLASATPVQRIASVMDEPAIEPIRLYVGLTSAGTVAERASLALAELERTGALDRGLLVLCSPTGSGLVNYVAVSAWEYLTRGDCASLTLQYSLRPSVLSLDRVDEGRELNQALMAALRSPRVVLFGESLGAFTSQDTFLHTGTRGLRVHFVDRATGRGRRSAPGAREYRCAGMCPGW